MDLIILNFKKQNQYIEVIFLQKIKIDKPCLIQNYAY